MELKDKVVLITGSSSGIGRAIAIRFAKEGAKVVIHYRQNEAGGKEVLALVDKLSTDNLLVQADLSQESDIVKMFDKVKSKYGRIDILINNAASPTEIVPFWEASQEDMIELIKVNVLNAVLCARLASKIMAEQKGGKIINTSSIKGWENGGGSVLYALTKAAINSFTKTFAKQVAPLIQVNAVAPGYVKTRVYDNQPEEKIKDWLDGTYLKRWITEEEVADAFVFLAKNDAMTGQIVYVDGGFTLK